MNFQPENIEEILESCIGGFRQYRLGKPVSLTFVSKNLCDMIGYTKAELVCETEDHYASLVHPKDRQIYSDLLYSLDTAGKTASAAYRIVRKDGSVIYVKDTLTTKRLQDGSLAAYSVLTDITALKAENDNLRFLNETVPCGMLKYTCEKNPKVTYVNDQMLKMLRFPEPQDGEADYLELYRDNIYFMIPMEERRKFSLFLKQVYAKGTPIAGEISVLRCDGTRARLYGWVTKVVGEDGREEFQSVCVDVTERYRTKRATETERYLKALSDVYDKIFEYDFANKTVKYLYGNNSDTFGRIRNLPMPLEEATEKWIQNSVWEEDRCEVKEFFDHMFALQASEEGHRPPQIQYRAVSADGEIKKYLGIFLRIRPSVSLFCCKSMLAEQEADKLRNENISLKNMQELVMRFTEGVVAFEVENNHVKPLYASDNACNFFGYTKEEWFSMAENGCSIKDFISQSRLSYEEVEKLFAVGEAEFTYFDIAQNTHRRIKAICSQKNSTGNAPFYVMLYNMDNDKERHSDGTMERPGIYIRTFGYFDVFVDDKPIAFRNKKAKELFALLVDRRGGYVSSEEAISFLWENESVNAVTLARYRKEALRLKNTLEEYGITDIMESVDGKRRIVPEKVRCDLYDYLSHKEEYAQLFKGSYLTNYSWGETTLGELLNQNLY